MSKKVLLIDLNVDFNYVDDRGTLVQLVNKGFNQINYIYSKKNTLRGNHYHEFNEEAFFVINGSFEINVKDFFGNNEIKFYKSGDFFLIPKNVLHSFHFLEDTELISMYTQGVTNLDGTMDIHVDF